MPDIDTGVSLPTKTNSITAKSTSGQLYGNRVLQYKAAEFTMSNIKRSQKAEINTCWQAVDIVEPFFMLIWEDSLDVEDPVYCAFTEELEWNKQSVDGDIWSLTMKIEECF